MSVKGLDKMTERILGDAEAKAGKILAEAQKDCERISAEYAARAEEIRSRLRSETEHTVSERYARAESTAAMQKRNYLMQQQSDMIDSVFTDAREWVTGEKNTGYPELLAGLLAAALYEEADTAAKNRALYGDEEEDDAAPEVLLNKDDRKKYGETVVSLVRKKLTGKVPEAKLNGLKLSEKTLPICGGAVLRCGDTEFNCSLEMIFSQLRRELEADVSRALFESRGQA